MSQLLKLHMDFEGLRLCMVHGFEDKLDEIKEFTTKAIDEVMKNLSENGGLEKVIIDTVHNAIINGLYAGIKDAVNDGIEEYFSNGPGKEFVTNAILERLTK